MPNATDHNPNNNRDEFDFNLLREAVQQKAHNPFEVTEEADEEPKEDFWAAFSMITHTGDRFTINVCFSSRKHYNAEMHKLETAKNLHVVLKDANDESVVIKRDMLLHVLPSGQEEQTDKPRW